ncbi:PAS domain-containing protein, partial [Acinetobacter baumannii]
SLTKGLEFVSDSIRQWGHDPAELIGTSGIQLVHPDDRESFVSKTAAALRGEQLSPDGRVHRFRTRDGWRWFEGNPRPIRDASGDITAM